MQHAAKLKTAREALDGAEIILSWPPMCAAQTCYLLCSCTLPAVRCPKAGSFSGAKECVRLSFACMHTGWPAPLGRAPLHPGKP